MDSFSRIDASTSGQLREYLEHMGNVRRIAWGWSFKPGRYSDDKGPEYAKTPFVPLTPQTERGTSLLREHVDILVMEDEVEVL